MLAFHIILFSPGLMAVSNRASTSILAERHALDGDAVALALKDLIPLAAIAGAAIAAESLHDIRLGATLE
jgi:hypothetical protein